MSSNNKPATIRVWAIRLLHWSVIALCLVYAFWDLDIELFMSTVSRYSVLAVLVATAFTFCGYIALSGRLTALSRGKLGFVRSITGTIIGQGVNNILPAKLGEAVKAVYLARESGQSNAWLIGLVFWERFFDLNALLLLGVLIVISVNSPLSVGAFSLLVVMIWLVLIAIRQWPGVARTIVQRIPFPVARKFSLELVEHLIQGLKFIVVFRVSIWTFLIWLLYVGQVALILLWAAQLELTLTAVLVIFVVSGIGMNLAASPGGLGVYEAAIVVSASWFGIGREEALASAIVLRRACSGCSCNRKNTTVSSKLPSANNMSVES